MHLNGAFSVSQVQLYGENSQFSTFPIRVVFVRVQEWLHRLWLAYPDVCWLASSGWSIGRCLETGDLTNVHSAILYDLSEGGSVCVSASCELVLIFMPCMYSFFCGCLKYGKEPVSIAKERTLRRACRLSFGKVTLVLAKMFWEHIKLAVFQDDVPVKRGPFYGILSAAVLSCRVDRVRTELLTGR